MLYPIYSYKKDKNKPVSRHFCAGEFASISEKKLYGDEIIVDEKLVMMLEKLFETLECACIKIVSGYRTREHDKAVGGNGYGQHTKGQAADVICFGRDGVINSKIVCCAAEDIGFKGIVNMPGAGETVHLDVRSSGVYRGDGTRGISPIWEHEPFRANFHEYFDVSGSGIENFPINPSHVSYCVLHGDSWSGSAGENCVCGTSGIPIRAAAVRSDFCEIRYRVHLENGRWLPWVDKFSLSEDSGYAGTANRYIDGFQMSALSPIYKAEYRVSAGKDFLPWITEYNNVNEKGYAGIFGIAIDRIQIKLKRI